MKVWVIAAFAKIITQGNLAGVVLVDNYPSDDVMQQFASKLNHSETAFLRHRDNNVFEIRWFTPKYEVNLCGHATLASAFLLLQQKLADNEIKFISKSGVLRAFLNNDGITLDFPLETTAELTENLQFDWEKALGGAKPTRVVAAFGTFKEYLVELATQEEVANLIPDIDEIRKLPGNGLIVTARGKPPYDMVSRIFAPQDGIPEDPVCISAHVKLAHYWGNYFQKSTFLAYQASARGGEIRIERLENRVLLTGNAIEVEVLNF